MSIDHSSYGLMGHHGVSGRHGMPWDARFHQSPWRPSSASGRSTRCKPWHRLSRWREKPWTASPAWWSNNKMENAEKINIENPYYIYINGDDGKIIYKFQLGDFGLLCLIAGAHVGTSPLNGGFFESWIMRQVGLSEDTQSLLHLQPIHAKGQIRS